jgi:hypothetical protein
MANKKRINQFGRKGPDIINYDYVDEIDCKNYYFMKKENIQLKIFEKDKEVLIGIWLKDEIYFDKILILSKDSAIALAHILETAVKS